MPAGVRSPNRSLLAGSQGALHMIRYGAMDIGISEGSDVIEGWVLGLPSVCHGLCEG